jgi:pimeloyl-ACP methyl ester carboxylesterase
MVIDMLPFLGTLFGPPGATAETVKPVAEMLLMQMRTSDPASRQTRSAANLERMIDNAAMRPAAIDDAMKSDQDVVARAYHELIVTDLRPELARISVPTTVLYVTAKVPGLTEEQLDARYREAYAPLKGVTLKRVAASAHFIMWDQPQQFQADVRRFLGAPVQAR